MASKFVRSTFDERTSVTFFWSGRAHATRLEHAEACSGGSTESSKFGSNDNSCSAEDICARVFGRRVLIAGGLDWKEHQLHRS